MKYFIRLGWAFAFCFGKIDAMYLANNDSQATLITAENMSAELIEPTNNFLNLREISLFDDDIESVKACIGRGDDVNMIKLGITPLMYAIANDSDEIALYLLDHGANPNQETKYGFPSDLAIRKGKGNLARALIIKTMTPFHDFEEGELVDDNTFWTEVSLFDNNIESTKMCLERGDDVNMVQLGTTPLANAIVNDSDEIVRYLLKQGADPNQETKYGFPLDLAMRKRKDKIAKILIRNGANIFNVFNILNLENPLSKF